MEFRNYDPKKDKEAVHRIWREIGWLEEGKEEAMNHLVACGRALVADINGEAECLVTTAPGTIRYLGEELPFSSITGVTTSRIARKKGLATRLTAHAMAEDTLDDMLVCGLGIFEQGFYSRLGFGIGGYEHWIAFDPSQLNISIKPKLPRRITADDWKIVHASRLARSCGHGSCSIDPPEITRAEMLWAKNGFGLGYCDGSSDELTHHFWCTTKDVEHGPYDVKWITFQTSDQFLELMALIKSLSDQVRLVRMREPQGIQLQDLLDRPFKQRQVSKKSKFESNMHAIAYWQIRICDLLGCLERTHLKGDEVRFNLKLSDPIEDFLDESAPWHGLTGEYVVTLGPSSSAEQGMNVALPTLTATVGAFTRMWFGVRPATGLAMTDQLSGPQELLERLDWAISIPNPKPDWDF
ncbi:MAG: GNAT family N-acetyltransferase [Candidatus Methanofastidiosia archaeon]